MEERNDIENYRPEALNGSRTHQGEDVELRLFQRPDGTQFFQVVVSSHMGRQGRVLAEVRRQMSALTKDLNAAEGDARVSLRFKLTTMDRRARYLEAEAKRYIVKKIGELDRSRDTGTTEASERQTVGTLAGALAEQLCEQCGDTYDPDDIARMAMEAHRELMLDIEGAASSSLAH